MDMSTITLSDVERMELTCRVNSRCGRADDACRVRLILLGCQDAEAESREEFDYNFAFIDRWSKR